MSAGNIVVAVAAAVIAGGLLALTGVLQQYAASERPQHESLSPRLIASLLRNRVWRLGVLSGMLSYAFQGLALAFGPLSVVQPVLASELLFAAPISVRLRKTRMGTRAWIGVVSVPVGLATSIVLASPRKGNPLPSLPSWGIAIGVIAAAAGCAVAAGRRFEGPVRASTYAFAAAAVLALQSALFAATVALMSRGIVALFTAWEPYSLIPVTAAGILLVESAYQAGPLVASMPVMDAVEPSVAITIGVALFGEHIGTSAWRLAGTAIGLALFFAGIVLLDTSPVVRKLQRSQEEQRETR